MLHSRAALVGAGDHRPVAVVDQLEPRPTPRCWSDEMWLAYLEQWQRTPRIDARLSGPRPTHLAFMGALIEAREMRRGARVTLVEWRHDDLVVLSERAVPAARGG